MNDREGKGLVDPLPRRAFLKTLLGTAAAGTVILEAPQAARADATGPVVEQTADGGTQTVENVGGRNVIISRVAKDGLLPKFVAGTLVSADAGSVTVYVPLTDSNVQVEYMPTTPVTAGGETVLGDVSACNVGDRLNMVTYFGSAGLRVAKYIRANVVLGYVRVLAVDATGFTASFQRDSSASPYHITTGSASMPTDPVVPGDYWHVFGTSSSPDYPDEIWGGLLAPVG